MADLSIRTLQKIVLGTAIAAACVTIWASAYADINDQPFFGASAVAIVIEASVDEANAGVAHIAADFALLNSVSGTTATDIIGVDGFVMNSQSGWLAGHDCSMGMGKIGASVIYTINTP